MSATVIVHDTRLHGRTPPAGGGFINFDVGEDTPIDDFFNRCRSIAVENDGISTLYIMAHGAEMEFAGHVGGGYGIVFCQEYITADNVERFALLADKVERIVLLVCAAAAVSVDFRRIDVTGRELSQTFHGDGNEMCRQMAIHAQAEVTAAREVQAYLDDGECYQLAGHELFCTTGTIDFGDWEGTVVTYDAQGNIIEQWTNASAWRDTGGQLHDPRLEPRP